MDAKTQQQYAETFHGLHRKGDPLILFNAWDVATAKAIAKASPAVATSSWAIASALGYADGEDVPLDMVTGLVSRMTAAVSVPVSIDLEAGYGDTPDAAAESVTEILRAGAIGINIEDGLFGGKRQRVRRFMQMPALTESLYPASPTSLSSRSSFSSRLCQSTSW